MLNAYEDVERNFSWMRTVTQEEAQNCKARMSIWATSDKKPSGGSWGEWIYEPIKEKEIDAEPRLVAALEDVQIYNEFAPFSANTDKNISENSLNKWIYEPEFSLVESLG